MGLLIKLFEVLFPVFISIGIGYWYGKRDTKLNTKFILILIFFANKIVIAASVEIII